MPAAVTFPGAEPPNRSWRIDAGGVGLAAQEWGDPTAPPLLLVHGGFDFARTFDHFAPLLAAAGWRVVSWDQRGHGDSDRAELYSYDADIRDALAVFDAVSPGHPMPVVGHSKGGGMMIQLADAQPHRFTHLVNIDGIPYQSRIPDVAEHTRTKMMAAEIAGWLQHRRHTATATRKPGTLDELATRRGRMNPRLTPDWLRYLASVGAREDADGWRWKIDPTMRFGGFGPWRPEWTVLRLPGLSMPFLGILGTEPELMGWGTQPERVRPYLPPGGRLEILDNIGHFVHVEQPTQVANLVLQHIGNPGKEQGSNATPQQREGPSRDEGLGVPLGPPESEHGRPRGEGSEPPPSERASSERGNPAPSDRGHSPRDFTLTHNRISLALHQLRAGAGRPLLVLHGLGESSPTEVPTWLDGWSGPVAALDFTGHGDSTLPVGGGYTAEILLADADAALAELGQVTVFGRGLGAYIALQLAGSRPADVIGAVLADGAGLAGGATVPTSQSFFSLPASDDRPDPYALLELSRDLRPPDYAAAFVRLAVAASALDEPISVTTVFRPPWIEAVAAEPGVAQSTIRESLSRYARA